MWLKTIIIGWSFNAIQKNQGLRHCLFSRHLSCKIDLHTKEDMKEETSTKLLFRASSYISMVPHAFSPVICISHSPLFLTQVQENKAPEEVRADKNWI